MTTLFLTDPIAAEYQGSYSRYDARESSCLSPDTRIRVMDHQGRAVTRTAREIFRAFNGARPYTLVLDTSATGGAKVARVRGAVETLAQGYDIRFSDGRSVHLTGSHIIPAADSDAPGIPVRYTAIPRAVYGRLVRQATKGFYPVYADDESSMAWFMERLANSRRFHSGSHGPGDGAVIVDRDQHVLDAISRKLRGAESAYRPVEAGDALLDGTVSEVRPLGQINAIRFYLDQPGWMITADGLRVGHRLHEIVFAWVHGQFSTDDSGTAWNPETGTYGTFAPRGEPVHLSKPGATERRDSGPDWADWTSAEQIARADGYLGPWITGRHVRVLTGTGIRSSEIASDHPVTAPPGTLKQPRWSRPCCSASTNQRHDQHQGPARGAGAL